MVLFVLFLFMLLQTYVQNFNMFIEITYVLHFLLARTVDHFPHKKHTARVIVISVHLIIKVCISYFILLDLETPRSQISILYGVIEHTLTFLLSILCIFLSETNFLDSLL